MLIDPSRAVFENRSVATCAAMDNVRWHSRGSCIAGAKWTRALVLQSIAAQCNIEAMAPAS
jgi:hypothetical protein